MDNVHCESIFLAKTAIFYLGNFNLGYRKYVFKFLKIVNDF